MWPDRFFVTNPATQAEIAKLTQSRLNDVQLLGSAHFEALVAAGAGLRQRRGELIERFDATPHRGGSALLPAEPRVVRVAYFSGNPELSDHLEILNALLRLLKEWQSHQERTTALRVVVRIHPRTPAPIQEQLVAACEGAFARGAVRNKPPAQNLPSASTLGHIFQQPHPCATSAGWLLGAGCRCVVGQR